MKKRAIHMGHEIPQIDLEEIQIPLHFLAGIGEKISSKQVERCLTLYSVLVPRSIGTQLTVAPRDHISSVSVHGHI